MPYAGSLAPQDGVAYLAPNFCRLREDRAMQSSAVSSTSLQMSATAASTRTTAQLEVDAAVLAVRDHAREFARLGPAAKAALVRACIPRLLCPNPATP